MRSGIQVAFLDIRYKGSVALFAVLRRYGRSWAWRILDSGSDVGEHTKLFIQRNLHVYFRLYSHITLSSKYSYITDTFELSIQVGWRLIYR